ncbi:KEOPS complex subunit Pcc1 [Haloferacaceae archaeon DSL9]
MRRAVIETDHEHAEAIAASLLPDNTESMRTTVSDSAIRTIIERETTGGLQSTVDDYVVNLSVAEAVTTTARGDARRGTYNTDTTYE